MIQPEMTKTGAQRIDKEKPMYSIRFQELMTKGYALSNKFHFGQWNEDEFQAWVEDCYDIVAACKPEPCFPSLPDHRHIEEIVMFAHAHTTQDVKGRDRIPRFVVKQFFLQDSLIGEDKNESKTCHKPPQNRRRPRNYIRLVKKNQPRHLPVEADDASTTVKAQAILETIESQIQPDDLDFNIDGKNLIKHMDQTDLTDFTIPYWS